MNVRGAEEPSEVRVTHSVGDSPEALARDYLKQSGILTCGIVM